MAVLAGGCRCGRGGPRGVGGALNRGSAPYLGTALGLHPFRTQWVGSTAVVPIAHRRGLIKHLQVNESSLRGSPFLLRVCRCLAGTQPRCLPATFFPSLRVFSGEARTACPPLPPKGNRSSHKGNMRSRNWTGWLRFRCRCMTRCPQSKPYWVAKKINNLKKIKKNKKKLVLLL